MGQFLNKVLSLKEDLLNLQRAHFGKMFKFTTALLLFDLLFSTVKGAEETTLADVESNVTASQEGVIEQDRPSSETGLWAGFHISSNKSTVPVLELA